MPALNSKKQFVPKILSKEKRQTIRAFRKDGRDPKPGDTLYLYCGMRTKQCKKLLEVTCKSVQKIRIEANRFRITNIFLEIYRPPIYSYRYSLNWGSISDLAIKDGFDNTTEFFEFFNKYHHVETTPFEGLLIKW